MDRNVEMNTGPYRGENTRDRIWEEKRRKFLQKNGAGSKSPNTTSNDSFQPLSSFLSNDVYRSMHHDPSSSIMPTATLNTAPSQPPSLSDNQSGGNLNYRTREENQHRNAASVQGMGYPINPSIGATISEEGQAFQQHFLPSHAQINETMRGDSAYNSFGSQAHQREYRIKEKMPDTHSKPEVYGYPQMDGRNISYHHNSNPEAVTTRGRYTSPPPVYQRADRSVQNQSNESIQRIDSNLPSQDSGAREGSLQLNTHEVPYGMGPTHTTHNPYVNEGARRHLRHGQEDESSRIQMEMERKKQLKRDLEIQIEEKKRQKEQEKLRNSDDSGVDYFSRRVDSHPIKNQQRPSGLEHNLSRLSVGAKDPLSEYREGYGVEKSFGIEARNTIDYSSSTANEANQWNRYNTAPQSHENVSSYRRESTDGRGIGDTVSREFHPVSLSSDMSNEDVNSINMTGRQAYMKGDSHNRISHQRSGDYAQEGYTNPSHLAHQRIANDPSSQGAPPRSVLELQNKLMETANLRNSLKGRKKVIDYDFEEANTRLEERMRAMKGKTAQDTLLNSTTLSSTGKEQFPSKRPEQEYLPTQNPGLSSNYEFPPHFLTNTRPNVQPPPVREERGVQDYFPQRIEALPEKVSRHLGRQDNFPTQPQEDIPRTNSPPLPALRRKKETEEKQRKEVPRDITNKKEPIHSFISKEGLPHIIPLQKGEKLMEPAKSQRSIVSFTQKERMKPRPMRLPHQDYNLEESLSNEREDLLPCTSTFIQLDDVNMENETTSVDKEYSHADDKVIDNRLGTAESRRNNRSRDFGARELEVLGLESLDMTESYSKRLLKTAEGSRLKTNEARKIWETVSIHDQVQELNEEEEGMRLYKREKNESSFTLPQIFGSSTVSLLPFSSSAKGKWVDSSIKYEKMKLKEKEITEGGSIGGKSITHDEEMSYIASIMDANSQRLRKLQNIEKTYFNS